MVIPYLENYLHQGNFADDLQPFHISNILQQKFGAKGLVTTVSRIFRVLSKTSGYFFFYVVSPECALFKHQCKPCALLSFNYISWICLLAYPLKVIPCCEMTFL